MCGLAGVALHELTRTPDAASVRRMCAAIAHRGPDDAGTFVAPGVGLGSRRLAIVDLSPRGHMPMQTADGRYTIVYNGEVYNAGELRETLRGRGYTFRSTTDTEVLLALYADEGAAMLPRLNGMFAFAIWDRREHALFVARDRLGVKPLYFAVHEGALHFASEQKALFAGGVPATFDATTWDELLCFRYVAGERTPFAGVRRLLPGHWLTWRSGTLVTRRWWTLSAAAATREPDPDPVRWYRDTFDSSIGLRRISDVPVGVLLSGGLDSGTIAASLAKQAGSGVASFTVAFEDAAYDETALARQVVARSGLSGHELTVAADELLPRLTRASWLNDEPLAHGNELHIEALSAYARPHVTVLLSGEGADETLGGYVRYRPLQHPRLLAVARAAVPLLPRGVPLPPRGRKLERLLRMDARDAAVLFNACEVLPMDLARLGVHTAASFPYRETVMADAGRVYAGEPVRQAMYSDQHTFLCSLLDRNDRMTMGASIECREPFLDHRLVEGLAAMPTAQLLSMRRNKRLLRDSLGDRLPPDVLAGRKWGFGVPWARYLRRIPALRAVAESLPDCAVVLDGPFERRAVRTVVSRMLDGRGTADAIDDALVRQLMMVQLWHGACVTGPHVGTVPSARAAGTPAHVVD